MFPTRGSVDLADPQDCENSSLMWTCISHAHIRAFDQLGPGRKHSEEFIGISLWKPLFSVVTSHVEFAPPMTASKTVWITTWHPLITLQSPILVQQMIVRATWYSSACAHHRKERDITPTECALACGYLLW